MKKLYLRNEIVMAEPKEDDGYDGYEVIDCSGRPCWIAKDGFEKVFRALTDEELNLILPVPVPPNPPRSNTVG